jgi:hypothetical protein
MTKMKRTILGLLAALTLTACAKSAPATGGTGSTPTSKELILGIPVTPTTASSGQQGDLSSTYYSINTDKTGQILYEEIKIFPHHKIQISKARIPVTGPSHFVTGIGDYAVSGNIYNVGFSYESCSPVGFCHNGHQSNRGWNLSEFGRNPYHYAEHQHPSHSRCHQGRAGCG